MEKNDSKSRLTEVVDGSCVGVIDYNHVLDYFFHFFSF